MDNNPKPEIAFTSDGNSTYTLVIGHDTWKNLTLDEVLAIISGKEIGNEH